MTRQKLNRILITFCAALLGLMVVEALWQVITRYVFNSPSVWTDEMLRFQLIWLTMIGAPTAHGLNRVMAVTILTDRFSELKKNTNKIVVETIILIFSIFILIIGGFGVALNASTQVSATLGINMFFIYVSVPVSGLLFSYYVICNLKDA
ncbi:MAG: TRAP transporter small permease, partial [Coprobacillaceae bacterium]